jgi:hypothetical protein
MKKNILLFACLFSAGLFAENLADALGDIDITALRTPGFLRMQRLRHPDEQQLCAKFSLLLTQAHESKKAGDHNWIAFFDGANQLLEAVQHIKSIHCREVMLKIAQESNFKDLHDARHSLSGVVQANLGRIVANVPTALSAIASSGKLHKLYDEHRKLARVGAEPVFYVSEDNTVIEAAEKVAFDVTQQGGRAVTTVVDLENTSGGSVPGSIRVVKRGKISTFSPPGMKDLAWGAIPIVGAKYDGNTLTEGDSWELIPLAFLTIATFYGLQQFEFATPEMKATMNAGNVIYQARKLLPLVNDLRSQWGKPCQLFQMERKLKQDKKKEKRLAQEAPPEGETQPLTRYPFNPLIGVPSQFPPMNPAQPA